MTVRQSITIDANAVQKEEVIAQRVLSSSAVRIAASLWLALAVSACGETAIAPDGKSSEDAAGNGVKADSPEWDGKKRRDTDAIVQLNLGAMPKAILLNGQPALAIIDKQTQSAKVLIPSDDNGISCENSFLVTFEAGETGQLLANHCQGDEAFDIKPGDTIDRRVTKEDVDNPADDEVSGGEFETEASLAFKWSANGFEQIPEEYTWMGSNKRDQNFEPNLSYGIPETDDTIWSASCGLTGQVEHRIYVDLPGEVAESTVEFRFETEKSPHTRVYKVRYVDQGLGTSIQWPQSVDDPMFAEMKAGGWAYLQIGTGDDASKLRFSLDNAAAALNSFLPACG